MKQPEQELLDQGGIATNCDRHAPPADQGDGDWGILSGGLTLRGMLDISPECSNPIRWHHFCAKWTKWGAEGGVKKKVRQVIPKLQNVIT
eukprot:1161773-Pelagomonas_calceolata.AAC.15